MKKSFSRILSIVLCIALSLCLFSCENNQSDNGAKDSYTFETSSTKNERTVYVSKSGKKIHRNKNCSGMKYYWEMSYSDAVDAGYDFCNNCY